MQVSTHLYKTHIHTGRINQKQMGLVTYRKPLGAEEREWE